MRYMWYVYIHLYVNLSCYTFSKQGTIYITIEVSYRVKD